MDSQHYRERVLVAALIGAATVLLVLLLWTAGELLLVVFAGVLLAIGWAGLARLLSERLPIGQPVAVLVAVGVTLSFFALVVGLSGPGLADQAQQLGERIPEVVEGLRENPWMQRIEQLEPTSDGAFQQKVIARRGGAFSTALGALSNLVIILAIGVYGALQPHHYTQAAIALVPPGRRKRATEVLDRCTQTLRWWIAGRLASMSVVGVLTAAALAIAGIPLALVLGLIAGLLAFIPYVGPLLSAVPAILVGLGQSAGSALIVAGIFAGVQTVESYVITPLIDQRAVSIPPAALLTAQLIAGVLFGLLGVLLATPLAVTATVLVRLLYVEDVLGDAPGSEPT
jgi:predicted PurR-regulated permease PerM